MILDIPLIQQEEGTKDCGIIGLEMLLRYYKINTSYSELKKELMVDQTGTYAPQIGSYLIKKGFDIEIITLNPGLFTNYDKTLSQKELCQRIKELYARTESQQNKKVLDYFIKFLEDGGKIKVKIPTSEDIIEEINNKRPLMAFMTTAFLKQKPPRLNFHLNLITGIDKEFVYVNDPGPKEKGGKFKHPINEFLYGIYASAYGDLDNACLIKAKIKKFIY